MLPLIAATVPLEPRCWNGDCVRVVVVVVMLFVVTGKVVCAVVGAEADEQDAVKTVNATANAAPVPNVILRLQWFFMLIDLPYKSSNVHGIIEPLAIIR